MKILINKYPKGTYKGQVSDGKYIDGYLYQNLKVLAKSIVNDMTFLGIIYSSTLEVGTGKSVLGTQIGEAWSEIMKEMHNIDLQFSSNNIVWRPKELIERSFVVPKYSFLLLDEWEDATYWSELGTTLRQFFRKCRQLNLFIIVIIPNFFQMNINYAISRSAFAIDVRFEDGFQRGFFYFYGFEAKRKLYIEGKRNHNYRIAAPDFHGRFVDGYGVPEAEYRAAKLKDLKKNEKNEKKIPTEREVMARLFVQLRKAFPKISQKNLAIAFGIGESTGKRYEYEAKEPKIEGAEFIPALELDYNTVHTDRELVWNEEELVKNEQQNTNENL